MGSARGRFAPSPTGDLHLGGARTALVAWLAARRQASDFVLRVEDTDGPRVVPGAESRIVEDLRWLGLDWDEGTDVAGPFSPYRQSERMALYHAALDRLVAAGRAYPCFCSRAQIAAASMSAPHGPSDEGPRYPGSCRELSAAHIAQRSATRRPSYRLRVEPGEIDFVDEVAGAKSENVAERVGDFVLLRADGIVAYQLAVVVDDAAMAIDEVVRGDDLLSSTARQIVLQRALELPQPRYAHVPLVLGPDGARLSKRHQAPSLRQLRERGVSPLRVVALLARSLGLASDDEISVAALVESFSWGAVERQPYVIDPTIW